jgi:hypothetical protein
MSAHDYTEALLVLVGSLLLYAVAKTIQENLR